MSNGYSAFSKDDFQNLIMNTLRIETDLVMKMIADGISLIESEEINDELRQIICNLNHQLMQHMLITNDYSCQFKKNFI